MVVILDVLTPLFMEVNLVMEVVNLTPKKINNNNMNNHTEPWEERFDKQFLSVEGNPTITRFISPRDTEIKSFISQELQRQREEIIGKLKLIKGWEKREEEIHNLLEQS